MSIMSRGPHLVMNNAKIVLENVFAIPVLNFYGWTSLDYSESHQFPFYLLFNACLSQYCIYINGLFDDYVNDAGSLHIFYIYMYRMIPSYHCICYHHLIYMIYLCVSLCEPCAFYFCWCSVANCLTRKCMSSFSSIIWQKLGSSQLDSDLGQW